jgi:uncharacterized protein (DUF2236 family)
MHGALARFTETAVGDPRLGDGARSAEDWVLGPDALAWRYVGDWRALLGAGRAFVLELAHPVVGAGVLDHSRFLTDPWGRLWSTLDSLMLQVYGGEQALAEGRRLREFHRAITGTDAGGRRYSALNPEAYAWVHLSIYDSTVAVQRWFGVPLTGAEEARLYDEWLRLGRVLGLRVRDLPPSLPEFRTHFERMVGERLEDNRSVRDLLASLSGRQVPPPHRAIPLPAWAPIRPWLGRLLTRATVGTLPPVLRRRLGLPWTEADERALSRLGAVCRAVVPRLPVAVRYHPTAAREIRRHRAFKTSAAPRA